MDNAMLNGAQPFCSDTNTRCSQPPEVAQMGLVEAAAQTPLQAAVAAPPPLTLDPTAQTAPAAPVPPLPPSALAALSWGLAWPPGYAGVLARYIFDSAPRPVAEVAIVGALGLLAGVCGRRWSTHTDAGLNLYVILVARSAIGKEAMHEGVARLIKMATEEPPQLNAGRKFVEYSDFASGPALLKAVLANPCFVSVTGEFGHKLNMIANSTQPDSAAMSLRRTLINLYTKSGANGVTGGIRYSDSTKSVASVEGVSYSMIGETTPGTFYQLLTPAMMEDGFLSRFAVVEYEGNRPTENHRAKQFKTLDASSLLGLRNLVWHALTPAPDQQPTQVLCSFDAQALLEDFSAECDENINAADDESIRQIWNRAHLKVLKISALLAVADAGPTGLPHAEVREEHAGWAVDFVRRDIETFMARLDGGDIGANDDARERKLLSVIEEYFRTLAGELPKIVFQVRTTASQLPYPSKVPTTAYTEAQRVSPPPTRSHEGP